MCLDEQLVCIYVMHARTRRDAITSARCMRRARGAVVRVIKLRVLKGGRSG
jgi:hypothetical protein